tara:strand:+ start:298 stop:687 length:390 start_codon:yes stop_codon:yes gene_type:complete
MPYIKVDLNKRKSQLESVEIVEGEPIELKIERITNNKEPISDGAPEIFTERKDGVISAYNIRTDRWEVAAEAMDKVSGSIQAKRDAKGKVSKSKEETESKEKIEKVETKAEVKKTGDGGAKPTEGTAKP